MDPEKNSPEQEEGNLSDTLLWARHIILNRRWRILLTASGFTLLAIAVLLQLPNRYQSEATLLVVQQQVPERYVVPTTTTVLSDALQAMTKEVLSRRRLLGIMAEFDLYADEKHRRAPEELISMMTADIEIEPLDAGRQRRARQQEDFNAFRIAFTARDPVVAQKVTSTLTSLFIQENLKTREEQATTTTNFLREQLQLKKQQLDEQEQRLREFKLKFLGELPEQQQGNLTILAGMQTQLQNTTANIGRAQQQRVYLETLLNAHRPAVASPPVGTVQIPGSTAPGTTPSYTLATEIAALKSQRAVLLVRYKPDHPDVENMNREIALKEAALGALANAQENNRLQERSAGADHAISPLNQPTREALAEENAVAQLRSQLEANRLELANLSRDEAHLKASVATYQSRLNMTPVREQELASIIRDTEGLRQDYADLQKKEQESQLARDLEKNQRGQQFRLVDAPSFPRVPVSPKRLKLSMGAAAVGVALGLLWALLLEIKRRCFYAEEQLRKHFRPESPLIVAMPVLSTPREVRRRKWRVAAECCAGMILVVLVGLAELYVFRFG